MSKKAKIVLNYGLSFTAKLYKLHKYSICLLLILQILFFNYYLKRELNIDTVVFQ